MYLKESVVSTEEFKKSRFITLLYRVKSPEEVKERLAQAKKDYPQATHYCSAWIIGNLSHSSDDGEPASTAGRPMLDVLKGSGLDEILAICVRYFGGTLLGKGGLVRAYSSGVSTALSQASFAMPVTLGLYEAFAPYQIAGKAESFLRSLEISDLECAYGANGASYTWMSEQDYSQDLQARFGGQVSCTLIDTCQSEQ